MGFIINPTLQTEALRCEMKDYKAALGEVEKKFFFNL